MKKATVLVAPLNWGLGHATRCIPVIRELTEQQADVIIASDGVALALLRRVFPELPSVELESYNITYQRNGSFAWHLFRQLPTILKTIKSENRQLAHYIKTLGIDAVISDNRFGMWHPGIPSVFITHQLFTTLKNGWNIASPLLDRLNHNKIGKFDEVWVPDNPGDDNLTGLLSHRQVHSLSVHFIGWLSHFSQLPAELPESETYDIAAILSGPEPQRTILEQKIIPQLTSSGKKCILVRGLPGATEPLNVNGVKVINYMNAAELYPVMRQSEVIICRSGYTSLMDLAYLQKKAILIPTPGQTEQEYLASYFNTKRYCPAAGQETFDIGTELNKLADYKGIPAPSGNEILKQRTKALIDRVRK